MPNLRRIAVILKSYVKGYSYKNKAGKLVTVAAHYDRRSKKGAEHAPGHGHDLSHMAEADRALFERMHKEQHLTHFYHAHALKKRIAEHERAVQTLEERAAKHSAEGAHKAAAKLRTRALSLKNAMERHKKKLAEKEQAAAWMAAWKEKHIKGAGELAGDAEAEHARYVEKLGSPWKKLDPNGSVYQKAPQPQAEAAKPVQMPPGSYKGVKTYTVTKRGRKWFEVKPDGKDYAIQMEINSASEAFQPGQKVSIPVNVKYEASRYGGKTTVYPLTPEQAAKGKADAARPEVEKWLKYVEDKAGEGWLYEAGAAKLDELGVDKYPDLAKRYEAAKEKIAKAKAEKAAYKAERQKEEAEKGKTYLNVPYDDKETAKRHGARWDSAAKKWYAVGEVPKALEKYREAAGGGAAPAGKRYLNVPYDDKDIARRHGAKWDSAYRSWYVTGEVPAALKKYDPFRPSDLKHGEISLSEGSGYGGRPYTVGKTIRNPRGDSPKYVTVVSASQRYYREDGLSFGVGDDSGYIYHAVVRPATDEEAAPVIAAEERAKKRTDAKKRLDEIERDIMRRATVPTGVAYPDGRVLFDDRNVYGGGRRIIVAPDAIWYMQGNGADGDNWAYNNFPSEIGYRMPYDKATAEELERIRGVLHEK